MSGTHPRVGDVLGDRYELLGVLGEGGQSILFRARDRNDGDEVAIKVLREGSGDPHAVERLFREAQAMMELSGTAAVRVLHQVPAPDGSTCLVMELLQGRNLNDRLHELETAKKRMPVDEMIAIFDPIVATLERAREKGIIHRDLKPENVFLIDPARGGGVRLLDFGFARFSRKVLLTGKGFAAGSPTHMAPEVWLGKEDIDHRADVYGLAVLLYRVLAGRPPFEGGPGDLIVSVTSAPRPSLRLVRPELPSDVDAWVQEALAIRPEDRFARAQACWGALRSCLQS